MANQGGKTHQRLSQNSLTIQFDAVVFFARKLTGNQRSNGREAVQSLCERRRLLSRGPGALDSTVLFARQLSQNHPTTPQPTKDGKDVHAAFGPVQTKDGNDAPPRVLPL